MSEPLVREKWNSVENRGALRRAEVSESKRCELSQNDRDLMGLECLRSHCLSAGHVTPCYFCVSKVRQLCHKRSLRVQNILHNIGFTAFVTQILRSISGHVGPSKRKLDYVTLNVTAK